MNLIKSIQDNKTSYFRNKLFEAKKLGDEWEGRDIRYYETNKTLEKNKILQNDAKEVKQAQLLHLCASKMRKVD